MPRLEGGLHRLKADPSARADDVAPMMRTVATASCSTIELAWLTIMCNADNRTAR